MSEQNLPEREEAEPIKERSPIVRILALLGAAAVLVLTYLIFRYGYLIKL